MDTGPVPVHIEAVHCPVKQAPKFCHFENLAQIGVQLTKPDDNAPHYITSAGDWLVGHGIGWLC